MMQKVQHDKLIRHLEDFCGASQFFLFLCIQADFGVSQIAGRIRSPGIVEMQIRTHPQTPPTGCKELTKPASALDVLATLF